MIFSTIISIKLYTLLDVTILGLMSNNAAVAYYTNADKIIRIIITVITAVGGVLLPRISRYKVEKRYEECASIVVVCLNFVLLLSPDWDWTYMHL